MGISLGLVGLGAFGSAFADMFKSHPAVDRVGLCDMEPERIEKFASKPGWKDKFNPKDTYATFDEIVRADFDALVIITQPWLHAPQAIEAMKRGKHVYSAVPIISLPDGNEIIDYINQIVELSRTSGKNYMLGETTYYRPETMFSRRKAAAGEFGEFVFGEGEYYHDVDVLGCSLRGVQKHRTSSKSGQEWLKMKKKYQDAGIKGGPMHYPTHSVSGPLCVMNTYAKKVTAYGFNTSKQDDHFSDTAFMNETAFFQLANGASMRINEYRKCGCLSREMFNLIGSDGSFFGGEHTNSHWGVSRWMTNQTIQHLTLDDMRDPLPPEVLEAFKGISEKSDAYGGHGGSHAYLVNEFIMSIVEERQSAINAWVAARIMAPGVMAHESALKGGATLDVPDWGDAPK